MSFSSTMWFVMAASVAAVQLAEAGKTSQCVAAESRQKAMTTGINSVVPGYWVRLNGDSAVCFMPKGNSPGRVMSPYDGFVGAIKLVHLYGGVTCDNSNPAFYSNWGCSKSHPAHRTKNLNVFITDKALNLLFDADGLRQGEVGWYGSTVFDPKSYEIVFRRMRDPQYVGVGFEMQVWYGEDLQNVDEHNNEGQTCVDVYAHFV